MDDTNKREYKSLRQGYDTMYIELDTTKVSKKRNGYRRLHTHWIVAMLGYSIT